MWFEDRRQQITQDHDLLIQRAVLPSAGKASFRYSIADGNDCVIDMEVD